jgi:hypothetical protein
MQAASLSSSNLYHNSPFDAQPILLKDETIIRAYIMINNMEPGVLTNIPTAVGTGKVDVEYRLIAFLKYRFLRSIITMATVSTKTTTI